MTDTSDAAKTRQPRPEGLFPDELLDALLSQLEGQDAQSLLGSPA